MEDLIRIAFPGLGIEEFTINRVAFTIFGLDVRWYGVIITCGIILAYLYASWRAKGERISTDDLLDVAMFTVIFGIIGARLYYVLTTLDQYNYDTFFDVINIRAGGLAIYGGVIAGALTIVIVAKIKHIPLFRLLDCVAPGVMLAQAIGRWGNFFNGEAFGVQTDIFCRMGLQKANWSQMYYYHPTFLYESLWNLLGFALLNLVYRRKKFDGQIALMYFAWYGLGRMFIEGLRTDSLYVGSFRISQVVAALSCVVSLVLLIIGFQRARKQKLLEGDYAVVYGRALAAAEPAEPNAEDAAAEEKVPFDGICPHCGAVIDPQQDRCTYCGVYFKQTTKKENENDGKID